MAIDLSHNCTLFVDPKSPFSKALSLMLLKKEITVTITTDPVPVYDVLAPAFQHNQFIVHGPKTVMEFINEFFPDPRLFPLDPSEKASHRMLVDKIILEVFPFLEHEPHLATRRLNQFAPAVFETPFCLNKTVFAIDCLLEPALAYLLQQPVSGLHPALHGYYSRLNQFFERKRELTARDSSGEEVRWLF